VWNGPESRDLRRAMLTGDLPSTCRACVHRNGSVLPPQDWMVFVDAAQARLGIGSPRGGSDRLEDRRTLCALAPEAPRALCCGSGAALVCGDRAHAPLCDNARRWAARSTRTTRFSRSMEPRPSCVCPTAVWARLEPNMGYWWTVWGLPESGRAVRAGEIRCLIRHLPIPRVASSTLYAQPRPALARRLRRHSPGASTRCARIIARDEQRVASSGRPGIRPLPPFSASSAAVGRPSCGWPRTRGSAAASR
jgi:hypothetical protein